MNGICGAVEAKAGGRPEGTECGGELAGQAMHRALLPGLQRWCLDVSDWGHISSHQWDVLLGLLPESESSRVKKFVRENDRRLALGSRLLQRAIVSKVFGLKFSDVVIRRTSERKPYFVGVAEAIRQRIVSPLLNNWNFNVSHQGKFVAIASEPVCLCGVDVVDTDRRSNERGSADDYFRCFTQHFTASEWDAIKKAVNDAGKLRRFYLNWGLKEAYIKAIGQGLGYDLRRVSFVEGEWLDCCSSMNDDATEQHEEIPCSPQGTHEAFSVFSSNQPVIDTARKSNREARGAASEVNNEEETSRKQENSVGCTYRSCSAAVEIDGVSRPDWSFQVVPLPDRYAACVARGPPSECSSTGLAAGVISDPNVGADIFLQGQSLPRMRFTEVKLYDIIPQEVASKLHDLI